MGLSLPLFLLLTMVSVCWAQKVENVAIVVNGNEPLASTDANYVCATIDWWPRDKCNYKQCPWGSSSITNLDLSHPLLLKAIQAFKPLRLRVGGSLQDRVVYNIGKLKYPCQPFKKMAQGLFGFSKGCLLMHRWDEVNRFFNDAGVVVTFGLNALYGRYKIRNGVWGGEWDSSNANNFINYTVSKGYHIDSWEFGNELSGSGVGASVDVKQYGKDLIKLKTIINNLYKNFNSKPLLVAPGGFYTKEWYDSLLEATGSPIVNAITHHIYNLGSGDDPNLMSKILNPFYLSEISGTFNSLKQTIRMHGPWASAWVGESGGAYNSGGHGISDAFVNSFWYLDQLGMAAKYGTKVYCRQTLIGGNYGLLDTTTFTPHPDYYSALLWHRLMGKEVLAVNTKASPNLRFYAHCSKGRAGITLLLINLSNHTTFVIRVHNNAINSGQNQITRKIKKTVSWIGFKAPHPTTSYREEYHLTPKDGDLRSKTMLLNGIPLYVSYKGDIPSLNPTFVVANSPISLSPLSIKFVVLPGFNVPCCK